MPKPPRRRAALAAGLPVLALAALPAAASAKNGAFADASSRNGEIARLQRAGYLGGGRRLRRGLAGPGAQRCSFPVR
jgi:hypothetical protein